MYARRAAAVELVLSRRTGGAKSVPRGKHIAPAEVLHLRWLTDPARPWAGVSPLQHAAIPGRLAAGSTSALRRGERAGRRVFARGAIRTSSRRRPGRRRRRRSTRPAPHGHRRREGPNALVESALASADSPASAPRKDFQVARFGANPPRDLVELRQLVGRDIGAACGVPARATRQHGIRANGARSLAAVCLDIG